MMVWGEHGGFLTAVRNSVRAVGSRLFDSALRKDVDAAKADCTSNFIPFMNGFTTREYERHVAQMLDSTFSEGLPEGTRWGFKEIRYLSTDMVDFFFRLFPDVKMIFSVRDPIDLCVASLRASWVVERLRKGQNGYNGNLIREVIYNTLLRIHVHNRMYEYAYKLYPYQVLKVSYEDLATDSFLEMCRINRFLHTAYPSEDDVETTSSYKVGRGQYDTQGDPVEIYPDNIRKIAIELYPLVQQGHVPDGIEVNHRWDFCIGIMPTDLHTFNHNI
jgi:hypothetical protein